MIKKGKKKDLTLLALLIILLLVINYPFINDFLERYLNNYETTIVERVIDGDTIVIENKTSVRLLGINCPEKGEQYYQEAKEFLENLVLNKTVKLEFGKDKYDRYKRILAYVHYDNQDINLELVENGFANYYFPAGKDKYYIKFKQAWEGCLENNKNLCEKSESKCSECIELKEFDYRNQWVVLRNICNLDCEISKWTIKDEGRKKFVFPKFILGDNKEIEIKVGEGYSNQEILFWKDQDYVWTSTGDTMFLRDSENKLVLWRSY
ncbi:MAG TPA: hypothetical protein ENG87_04080 [Candidatus Pacearchaeota archaeon]|nr:thermonuclease precursor [archaeon BMS3Abin17]HDK42533.1 hypothetical protein [Candidatus Pacearchaeota archaeon]HDZ60552.1 hypothetical protein [Candidatus Pacearchaeota archaeon]